MTEAEAFERLAASVRKRDFAELAQHAADVPDALIPRVAERLEPLFSLWSTEEPEAVDGMEHWPWFERLFAGADEPRLLLARSLTCECDPPDSQGLANMMRCQYLTNIEIVHVAEFDLEGCEELVFGGLDETFPALKRLHFTESNLTDVGLRALVATPIVERLISLKLSCNQLGPDSVDAIVAANFKNLLWLGLSSMELGRDAMRKLAGAPWVSTLRELGLDDPDDVAEEYDDYYYEGAGEDAPDIPGFRRW